jgi:hypothetical protein
MSDNTFETAATVYCAGAAFWFAFLWFGVFAAMHLNHPGWERIKDDVDMSEMIEGRALWPTEFVKLFLHILTFALAWPWTLPRTIWEMSRGSG